MTELNITDFGGKNDGVFDNTNSFKAAFEELAKNGGGKLVVNAGSWLTGPIDLVENSTLELKEGAELLDCLNVALLLAQDDELKRFKENVIASIDL